MKKDGYLYLAWVLTLLSVAGSLFFSEILKFQPCVLCWYQRVAMFPLLLVLSIGLLRNDDGVVFYAAPLAFLGGVVAAAHNLLYYGVIPKALSPCTADGPSCTEVHLALFGFVSIPLLSLLSFVSVLISLYFMHRASKEKS